MIDTPIVLAEYVHHETQTPNMVNWCDIGVANPNSNVLNFFELLMGSKNNKFSFFLIKLKHISGHMTSTQTKDTIMRVPFPLSYVNS